MPDLSIGVRANGLADLRRRFHESRKPAPRQQFAQRFRRRREQASPARRGTYYDADHPAARIHHRAAAHSRDRALPRRVTADLGPSNDRLVAAARPAVAHPGAAQQDAVSLAGAAAWKAEMEAVLTASKLNGIKRQGKRRQGSDEQADVGARVMHDPFDHCAQAIIGHDLDAAAVQDHMTRGQPMAVIVDGECALPSASSVTR